MARAKKTLTPHVGFRIASEVAEAAAQSYRLSGFTAVLDPDLPVKSREVFIPELNRVEVVETAGSVDRIQPWWIVENKVQFGEPRLA